MITGFYAGILGVGLIVLSAKVISARRAGQIALGDGGDTKLQRAIRVQANFCEYVPMALIVIALAELSGAWGWLIHLLGLALVAGRAVHAYGVSQEPERLQFRVAGMILTFSTLGLGSVVAILV